MATKLQWSKSGLRLNFDVSAQPTPRIQQAYPFPDIPIQEAQLLGVALEAIAQTSRSGIRVRSLGTGELPGTAGAVFSLKHAAIQGAITVEEEIAVAGRAIDLLVEQAIPGALHSFSLKRADAGQVTVWPAVSINTPADPTLGNITALQAAIASFGSDGILTVGEKTAAITTYSGLLSQVTTLRSQCATVGGTAPAQNTLLVYLQGLGPWPWNDVTAGHDTTIPVPATWTAKWGEIYTEIGALTSAIAAKLSSDTGTKLPASGTAANSLLLAGYAPDTAGNPNTIVRRDSAGGIAAASGSFQAASGNSTVTIAGTAGNQAILYQSYNGLAASCLATNSSGTSFGSWNAGTWVDNPIYWPNVAGGTIAFSAARPVSMGALTATTGMFGGLLTANAGGVVPNNESWRGQGAGSEAGTRISLIRATTANKVEIDASQYGAIFGGGAGSVTMGALTATTGMFSGRVKIGAPPSGGTSEFNVTAPSADVLAWGVTGSGYGGLSWLPAASPFIYIPDGKDLYVGGWNSGVSGINISGHLVATTGIFTGKLTASPTYNALAASTTSPVIARFNNGGAISLLIGGEGYTQMWMQAIQDDGSNNIKDLQIQPLGGTTRFGGNLAAPNVVYGDNATKTTNRASGAASLSDPLPSGFYDSYGATDMPSTTWYHCINSAHTGSYAGNQYQLQIAAPFWGRNKLYFRTLDSGNVTGGWQEIYHAGNIDTAPASLQALKSLVTAPQVGPLASRPAASSLPKGYYYATDATAPDGLLGALYYSDGSSWSAPQNPQTIAGRIICGTLSAGSAGVTSMAAQMIMSGAIQSLPYTAGAAGTVPSGFKFTGNTFLSTFYDGSQAYVQGEIGGNMNMVGYKVDGLALAKISGGGFVEWPTPGTYTWVCPRNITEVTLTLVGAGASGDGNNTGNYGGGGGGALKVKVPVTPLQAYSIVVGAGGTSSVNAAGKDGGDSTALGYAARGGKSKGPSGGITGPAGTLAGLNAGVSSSAKVGLRYIYACPGAGGGSATIPLLSGSTDFNSGGTNQGGAGGGGASAAGNGGVAALNGVTEAMPGSGYGAGGGSVSINGWASGAGAPGYARIDY